MQFDLHGARFFSQNRQAGLDVRRLKLGGESPFKAGNQAVLEVGDLRSRPVAGEHDLFVPVEERVERVKKFFLRTLLAAKKLDVVDQKEISLAIAFSELDQITVLDRIDELVDEELTGEVHHLRVFFLRPHVLTNRLHQMRFAEADAAVNKEWIVSARRRLRDSETGGMRNLVVRADHKRFETCFVD